MVHLHKKYTKTFVFLMKFPKSKKKQSETQFKDAKTLFEIAKTQFENGKTQFTGDLLAWTGRAMRSKKKPWATERFCNV